jgi:2-polyprenyl-6-methoxyphenol hydroxylase-like FAD-dependent oxidoreductase
MRVAVAGAGLGGLCLAQGLRQAGIDVVVYERDPSLDAHRQGYRLHLDARAGLALHSCLPEDLFELFRAVCGQPGRRMTVLNERLRVLHEIPGDPARDPDAPETLSTSIDRQTLREVLAARLGVELQFDHELTRFDLGGDRVRLQFAHGEAAEVDVLVGADGVGSVVRKQHLPHAEVVDTGSRVIYGKTLLDDEVMPLVPEPLHAGFTAIVGKGVGLAAGLVQYRERPELAAQAHAPDVSLSARSDYLMWAVSAQQNLFPVADDRLAKLDPAELHEIAGTMIRGFHPDVIGLVTRAEVDETFLARIRTSRAVPAWTPSRMTLLGDAIHAMSPARGSGANTALQDAALLCRQLAGADGSNVVSAIGGYEEQMRDYGFAAVLASQEAEAQVGARRASGPGRLLRRLTGSASLK